jgi:hypothetical protein
MAYLFYFFLFLAAAALVVTPIVYFFQIVFAIANYLGLNDWYNRRLFFQKTDSAVMDF